MANGGTFVASSILRMWFDRVDAQWGNKTLFTEWTVSLPVNLGHMLLSLFKIMNSDFFNDRYACDQNNACNGRNHRCVTHL